MGTVKDKIFNLKNVQGPACYYPQFYCKEETYHDILPYMKQPGHFLLRNNCVGGVTMSVTHDTQLYHMRVCFTRQGGVYFDPNNQFATMGLMLQYYAENEIPNKQQILGVRLVYPITTLSDGTAGKIYPRKWKSMPSSEAKRLFPQRFGQSVMDTSKKPQPDIFDLLDLKDPRKRPPEPVPRHDADYEKASVDDMDRLPEILRELQIQQSAYLADYERCACGLLKKDSGLYGGWEVHLSNEPETVGWLFYKNPAGETFWTLPPEVEDKLTAEQRASLDRLLQMSEVIETPVKVGQQLSEVVEEAGEVVEEVAEVSAEVDEGVEQAADEVVGQVEEVTGQPLEVGERVAEVVTQPIKNADPPVTENE